MASKKDRDDYEEGRRDSKKSTIDQVVTDLSGNHPDTDAYYKARRGEQLYSDQKGQLFIGRSGDKRRRLAESMVVKAASAIAVTLHLPATLYDHFKQRAKRTHHSVETELLEAVEAAVPKGDLPADLETMLSKLALLDDEALWQAAQDRLPEEAAARLEALNMKQQREGLTDEEVAAQADLVRGYERVMLARAEAAWLLQQRGHDVSELVRGG